MRPEPTQHIGGQIKEVFHRERTFMKLPLYGIALLLISLSTNSIAQPLFPHLTIDGNSFIPREPIWITATLMNPDTVPIDYTRPFFEGGNLELVLMDSQRLPLKYKGVIWYAVGRVFTLNAHDSQAVSGRLLDYFGTNEFADNLSPHFLAEGFYYLTVNYTDNLDHRTGGDTVSFRIRRPNPSEAVQESLLVLIRKYLYRDKNRKEATTVKNKLIQEYPKGPLFEQALYEVVGGNDTDYENLMQEAFAKAPDSRFAEYYIGSAAINHAGRGNIEALNNYLEAIILKFPNTRIAKKAKSLLKSE